MAITHPSQRTKFNSEHWLNIGTYFFPDDGTGNEFIQLQQAIREIVCEAQETLAPHDVRIVDFQTYETYDVRSFERITKIAIGFANKEDLAMATMLIKCRE
jgi:hypothetical protein